MSGPELVGVICDGDTVGSAVVQPGLVTIDSRNSAADKRW